MKLRKVTKVHNHHHFSPGVRIFYFWSPADFPRTQGLAGFCSLVSILHDFQANNHLNVISGLERLENANIRSR